MKIDGQGGVLGLGFLVFMTLYIHTQSIFFKHIDTQLIHIYPNMSFLKVEGKLISALKLQRTCFQIMHNGLLILM